MQRLWNDAIRHCGYRDRHGSRAIDSRDFEVAEKEGIELFFEALDQYNHRNQRYENSRDP